MTVFRASDEWLADYAMRQQGARQPAPKPPEPAQIKLQTRPAKIGQGRYPITALCRSAGLPAPVAELRFHPGRRWKFDFAWGEPYLVALEVDGGVWTDGRHTRGSGRLGDMEKASEAAILGWRLLYVTPDQVQDGTCLGLLLRALTVVGKVAS